MMSDDKIIAYQEVIVDEKSEDYMKMAMYVLNEMATVAKVKGPLVFYWDSTAKNFTYKVLKEYNESNKETLGGK